MKKAKKLKKSDSKKALFLKRFNTRAAHKTEFTISYQHDSKSKTITIPVKILATQKDTFCLYYDGLIYELLEKIGFKRVAQLELQLDEKIADYIGFEKLDEVAV